MSKAPTVALPKDLETAAPREYIGESTQSFEELARIATSAGVELHDLYAGLGVKSKLLFRQAGEKEFPVGIVSPSDVWIEVTPHRDIYKDRHANIGFRGDYMRVETDLNSSPIDAQTFGLVSGEAGRLALDIFTATTIEEVSEDILQHWSSFVRPGAQAAFYTSAQVLIGEADLQLVKAPQS